MLNKQIICVLFASKQIKIRFIFAYIYLELNLPCILHRSGVRFFHYKEEILLEINFENFKILLENTNKEATYRTAIHIKYSSKILNRRIISKNKISSF
jgi:gluconate kinase